MDISAETALQKLQQPFMPLARLIQILFIAGPFAKIEDLLAELDEPIDCQCQYDDPQAVAQPYLHILQHFEHMKTSDPLDYIIVDEQGKELDRVEAIGLWIGQQILEIELADINSILCGAEHCDLCCTGPDQTSKQDFFEIPLQNSEVDNFQIKPINSKTSRRCSANDDKPLNIDGQPFYQGNKPAIYHWQQGWSLILPRQTACPQLDKEGRCLIYPKRPQICRKPQIFAYIIEEAKENNNQPDRPTYVSREKLLAVWDCPYVKKLQDQIASYAELWNLEPIFKENKA